MEALMQIMMKLMQKRAMDNGASGAHDMKRWPADCKAVGFLAKIQVARSYDELLDVSSPLYELFRTLILPAPAFKA
jgi:hypothetical protein